MSEPTVPIHLDASVATVTLSRPDALNAITPEMLEKLQARRDRGRRRIRHGPDSLFARGPAAAGPARSWPASRVGHPVGACLTIGWALRWFRSVVAVRLAGSVGACRLSRVGLFSNCRPGSLLWCGSKKVWASSTRNRNARHGFTRQPGRAPVDDGHDRYRSPLSDPHCGRYLQQRAATRGDHGPQFQVPNPEATQVGSRVRQSDLGGSFDTTSNRMQPHRTGAAGRRGTRCRCKLFRGWRASTPRASTPPTVMRRCPFTRPWDSGRQG